MTQNPIIFSKYHGTGNDFVLIDNRRDVFNAEPGMIAAVCHRHFGIGADGLILLGNHPEHAFTMRYFNADGNESTMCGNGGRCAVAFAGSLRMFRGNNVTFLASDGKHTAVIKNNTISLKMQDVNALEKHEKYIFTDTGSPHYVTFVEDPEKIDVVKDGRMIRYSGTFKPEGTNVNFFGEIEPGIIFNRTYERGVENETLSCGTGSVAAAISAAILRHYDSNRVVVRTRGGELIVRFRRHRNGTFSEIWLEGPATLVFEGRFYPHNITIHKP